jgi:hypothetical protein
MPWSTETQERNKLKAGETSDPTNDLKHHFLHGNPPV